MSESREHKTRYNQKLQYIAAFEKWIKSEPSMILIFSWWNWKRNRPKREDFINC